jgi:formylglycine-generating enzyme required for sulfatase activity
VHVDGFFMDAHTVTNAQFRAFVAATGYVTVAERAPDVAELLRQLPPGTPPPSADALVPGSLVFAPTGHEVDLRDPSRWWRWVPGADWRHPRGPGSSIAGKDDYPVVHVAWADAAAYAAWAGGRLPTEAEWERAARGGRARTEFAWGDAPYDSTRPQAHIYAGTFPTHDAEPKPVRSHPPTGYGLYDMAGNVWQWTMDWYRPDTYARDAARGVVRNPAGPAGGTDAGDGLEPARVLRGGSFLCSDTYCRGYRVSARSPGAPDSGASHIGFRIVMTVAQWRQRDATAGAQERPDLSGRWTSEPPPPAPPAREVAAGARAPRPADLGSGWGRAITIAQDARTLTVEWAFFTTYDMQPPLRFVYALDGTERVNTIAMGRGDQPQRSRAAWVGRALVITTVHALRDPATGRATTSEVRQTLTLESPTSLVVETVRGGALGGPPSTTRTVYTRGGGT